MYLKPTLFSLVALVGTAFLFSCQPKTDVNSNETTTPDPVVAGDSLPVPPSTAPAAALPTEGLRIAWVHMDSLLHGYDYYFDMEREMADLSAKAERDLTAKGKALEKKVADFQDKASKGLLTRSEVQNVQEQLAQEQTAFLQLQDKMRRDLAEEEQVRMRKINNAIVEFINQYNTDKGYNYILSVGTLYADPRLCITRDVLNGLNAEYAKQKQAKK